MGELRHYKNNYLIIMQLIKDYVRTQTQIFVVQFQHSLGKAGKEWVFYSVVEKIGIKNFKNQKGRN